jgi:hypothetical protein
MRDNPEQKFNIIIKYLEQLCNDKHIDLKYFNNDKDQVIVLKFSKDNNSEEYHLNNFDLQYRNCDNILYYIQQNIIPCLNKPNLQVLL